MTAMGTPQPGIFALGTASHAYLELDAVPGTDHQTLVTTLAEVCAAFTTLRGVDLVAGLRPELWTSIARADTVPEATGFTDPIVGPDGFTMPATQHDIVLWIAGAGQDSVYDATLAARSMLAPVASLAEETIGWSYHGHFDLTGFIDGTENPPVFGAAPVAVVAAGEPGAGSSVLLLQRWEHDSDLWTSLPVAEQEHQARLHRARPAPTVVACGTDRPGRVRAHPAPQRRLRLVREARDDVRGFLPRPATTRRDAREHGGRDRGARRLDALHATADRRLLRDPLRRGPHRVRPRA